MYKSDLPHISSIQKSRPLPSQVKLWGFGLWERIVEESFVVTKTRPRGNGSIEGLSQKIEEGKVFDQIQFWAQIPTNIFPRNSEIRLALGNLIQSQFWSIKSVIILRYLSFSCTMYSLNIRFERDPLGNNFTWKGSFWQDREDTSRGRKTNDFHQRRHQIKIFSAKTGTRHLSKETFQKQMIVGGKSRNQEERQSWQFFLRLSFLCGRL